MSLLRSLRISAKTIENSSLGCIRCYSDSLNRIQSAPPKLPKEQQEEFERLQKVANSQIAIQEYNEKAGDQENGSSEASTLSKNDIGGFHPQYYKIIPEFEGNVNPKTGERGGPKQDPTKHGDWAFNGRVSDF